MSAAPVDLDRAVAPRPFLRVVAELTSGEATEIQPWEAHSELALVSPEVRLRLLELLPEREPYSGWLQPRATAPSPVAPPQEQPAVRARDLLRYTALRVGQTIRLGLTIVGAIFVLALLAEVLAH